MRGAFLVGLAALSLAIMGCGDDDGTTDTGPVDGGMDGGDGGDADTGPPDPPAPAPLDSVEQTARRTIPELTEHAYVVRVEHDVPHVYAANREDAWRVFGFVMAQDRFFQMDLTSRLAQGTLSEILGDAALDADVENRFSGATKLVDIFERSVSPEEAAEMDAFAEGVNAYLEAVRNRELTPPRELELAYIFFGLRSVNDLLVDWDRRDVLATGSTIQYGTSYETGDVGTARAFDTIDDHFTGFPNRPLRMAGLMQDIINHYAPPNDAQSAAGWGLDTAGSTSMPIISPPPERNIHLGVVLPESGVLARAERHLANVTDRFGRNDEVEGYGSNCWAMMGSATADGSSLLACDGHLSLSIPALFWSAGIDTVLMGGDAGETTRMVGSTIAGLPALGVGTNGRIAWGQTAYFSEVTDWYTEELVLDADGMPTASMFQGMERPLVSVDESIVVADIESIDSVGRTETLVRFETFDGRMINSIEGREVTADEPIGAGETRLNVNGDLIVPEDVDGDGAITAISFKYGPLTEGYSLLRAFRQFGLADTVEDFRQAMRHFIGYGGSMMASDADGSILYSGYHAVPCRDYLPRDGSNVWIDGADPRRLIDGTQYPAWDIPLDAEGRVDEAAAAAGGPEACAVPFDQWPQALDPAKQYVFHNNNDPAGIATDNDIFDDPYYIGGPWIEGYRAARIEELLQRAVTDGDADIVRMADFQADHHSNLGEDYLQYLLEAIEAARDAAAGTPAAGSPEERLAARWADASADYTEVETRMTEWMSAGFLTPSGVETFYHTPAAEDARMSVATSIFQAWISTFFARTLNDEGINSRLSPAVTGDTYRTQTMDLLLRGRGATNPLGLGSWDPSTEESVFFDDVTTTEIESSQEIAILALDEALAYLRSDPTGPGKGGYGSDSFDDWIWGLRHMVRFDSLVGDFLGDDETFAPLVGQFEITPERLPLMPDLASDDPRANLPHFPRPGDMLDLDAANPGFGLGDWTHGSGPVFRMVVALGEGGVRGQNIIPGGQSGLPASEHFDDQVQLWLANETVPMRYLPDEVVEGATGLERFAPN
jgi:penicillin amidase